MNMIDMGTRAK